MKKYILILCVVLLAVMLVCSFVQRTVSNVIGIWNKIPCNPEWMISYEKHLDYTIRQIDSMDFDTFKQYEKQRLLFERSVVKHAGKIFTKLNEQNQLQ